MSDNEQWTKDELAAKREAERAGLALIRAMCCDEWAYSLFDPQRQEFLKPDRPMTLQEARDECRARER